MKCKSLPLFVLFFISSYSFSQCLVSSYQFDGSALDGTGTNNGVLNGAIATADRNGASNAALDFDGTNDYIQVAEDFDYAERTVCVWFRAESMAATGRHIFAIDHPALTYGFTSATISDISGTPTLVVSVGSTSAATHQEPINFNQWYHLAVVRSASNYKIYLDCALLNTFTLGTSTSAMGTNATFFGCSRNMDRFFDGQLDDAKIYDCALTATEICNKLTGISDPVVEKEGISVYPNPVSVGAHLSYTITGNETLVLEITNMLGEKVYTQQVNALGKVYLDPAVFTSGIYIAGIRKNGQVVSNQKFIVE